MLNWAAAIVLSCTEFEVSWDLLGLGETPWQLDPPRSGLTVPERGAIIAGVVAGLRERGLGDGRGPGYVIGDLMGLLAHPEWALDVRFRADTLVAGVAACRGQDCAFAVRQGAEIALLALHSRDAPASLLALLGTITPGAGREVNLPADVLDAAVAASSGSHDRFTDELVWKGLARQDAVALTDSCRGVRMRGQFGASVSARDGGRRMLRAPYVVGFHHGATGHFRQVRRVTPLGAAVTVGPTDPARMLTDLGELVGSVGS